MAEMYQASNGKQIKDTNDGYRLQQAMGYDPAKHGNNFENFIRLEVSFKWRYKWSFIRYYRSERSTRRLC